MEKPLPPPTFDAILPPNKDYEYFQNWKLHPFRHRAESFEPVNAWWLAEAALLSYADEAFIRETFRRAGLGELGLELDFLGSGSTECFVAHNRDFVIVAFRGTEVRRQPGVSGLENILADFLVDAQCILVESGQKGKVHKGFKEALDRIWHPQDQQSLKACLDRIREEGSSRQTFWLTGHSSGAAFATLAAYRYGHAQGVYTFGSPRVGDKYFAADFTTSAYRFVNNNDFITRLPPSGWYEHVGVLKYIDRTGTLRDSLGLWERLGDGLRGTFDRLLEIGESLKSGLLNTIPIDQLADHAPIYYAIHAWNNYVRGHSAR